RRLYVQRTLVRGAGRIYITAMSAARHAAGLLGLAAAAIAFLLPVAHACATTPAWTTYHRDAARTGADPDGTSPLAPTVAWQSPGLGAQMWNQPLVMGGVVYAATIGDELYALDASSG